MNRIGPILPSLAQRANPSRFAGVVFGAWGFGRIIAGAAQARTTLRLPSASHRSRPIHHRGRDLAKTVSRRKGIVRRDHLILTAAGPAVPGKVE